MPGGEPGRQVGTDEPGAAGDEHSHGAGRLRAVAARSTARPPVLTIVTRATAHRADELSDAFGLAVEPFVVDGGDGDELRALVGQRWEQYAAAFDEHELPLAVVPLVLLRALERVGDRVAYLSAFPRPVDGGVDA